MRPWLAVLLTAAGGGLLIVPDLLRESGPVPIDPVMISEPGEQRDQRSRHPGRDKPRRDSDRHREEHSQADDSLTPAPATSETVPNPAAPASTSPPAAEAPEDDGGGGGVGSGGGGNGGDAPAQGDDASEPAAPPAPATQPPPAPLPPPDDDDDNDDGDDDVTEDGDD